MARIITYNPEIDIKLICQKLVELENRLSELEVTILGLTKETKQNKTSASRKSDLGVKNGTQLG